VVWGVSVDGWVGGWVGGWMDGGENRSIGVSIHRSMIQEGWGEAVTDIGFVTHTHTHTHTPLHLLFSHTLTAEGTLEAHHLHPRHAAAQPGVRPRHWAERS
jgi:hypothetical protein